MKNFKLFKMLAVLIVLITSINTAWAWNFTVGRTIYFDKQNCTDFGDPWFRLGNNDASMAGTMTLVAGTKYLYSYTAGSKWDNYGAFSVADDDGWTGSNSIYQNNHGITKQTDYQKYDLSSDCYLKITSSSNKDGDCQYYHVNNITSGDGELASLPTYSVTYDTPTNGTLTVQKYTGSTYTALSSGTTGLKPTQIIKITTSPNTHYGLKTLTVTGAVQIDGGNTYYITGNCTISATFDLKWNVKGGDSDAANGSDAMGDWATYIKLSYTGTANTYSGTVDNLLANTTYRFKVVELNGSGSGANDVYYGYGTNGGNNDVLSFVGQTTGSAVYTGNQHNLVLKTASAGTYTFTWNSSTNTISVGFPTVTHPSGDYIYFKNTKGWSYITAHIFNGTPISTGWQNLPVLSSFNFDGTNYYYAATGGNTNILASEGTTDTNTKKTADLTVSKGKGKYYDIIDKSENSGNEDATKWKNFTATLRLLTTQGETRNPSPTSVTVTYGAGTNINTDFITTSPQHDEYTFGGYYTEPGGSGIQVITEDEIIPSNLGGYTSSGKWIKTGASVSATLYAKWTQSVTLNKHNETSNGSVTMTYNSNSHPAITAPTKDHYTFAGWYTAESGGTMVMNTSGVLQNSATYTDASGKWTNSGAAPTLHAQWTEIPYTVTVNIAAGGGGSTNVSSVTDAKIVTGSSTITATPANAAWRFKEWQLGDGVTIKTGSTTSASITVNATQNSSVTAVFEPRFALMGSRNTIGGETEGMPGWTPKDALPSFTVNSVGEPDGSGNMTADLTCTRTLLPNRSYKFEIYDRESKVLRSTSASEAQVTLAANASVQLTSTWNEVGANTNNDVLINATGYGEYTFKITAISNDGYPTITVLRPTVYQNHMGWKYADKEGNLHDGDVGGNVTAVATEGGNEYDIADGGFVSQGSSITYTAHPATGYNFNGWYNNSDCKTGKFNSDLSWTNSAITAASNSYAQFVPKTYTITLNGNEATTAGTTSVTATYNSNVLSASIAAPKNTGNVFAGWYSGEGGTGDQVIDATGALRANVDGYTGAEGIWTKDATPVTLYAKWIAIAALDCWDENTWTCGDIAGFATPKPGATNWNTASNWPNNTAPTIETSVVLTSNMTVDADHAKAKEIVLKDGVKLTIDPNKGLEVAGTITKANGSAPTASDLVLGSSEDGNATLIFNNSNSAAATVQMYSKSVIADENTWNWQYIGSPYVSASALHNYYGCYLKKWGDPSVGWHDVANGASVEPWKAYSVTQESTSTFVMEGTLVPTDNIVELDIPAKPSWIVANSWTAPIYIAAMGEAFDEGTEKTVYLFNTGFAPYGAGTAAEGTVESRYAAGTYLTVPVNSAVSMGNPFISSMQGFVVKNTTEPPRKAIKLTLNYSTMVRPTIDREIAGGMMHAPKNIQEDEQPTVLKMLARGTNYDDCLYLLERADFTTGFDNGWDGSKLGDNAVAPRLYTTREDGTKESVSAVPELEGSILTFRAGEDNVYTFHFEYSEEAETLYLLDLDKNIYTRVLTGSTYTFTTNDKAEHPRFILTRYGAPQITTGVDEVYKANSARKQMINGTLYIIRDGRIYNAEGALVK